MNRREFGTAFLATASLAGVPGCSNVLGPDGLRLGGIVLGNRRAEPVEARLRVAQGGEVVLDDRFALAAADAGGDSGVFLNDAWEDRVAVYEVTLDVESSASESFEYTAAAGHGDCTVAHVQILAGTITFGSGRATDATPCAPTETAG